MMPHLYPEPGRYVISLNSLSGLGMVYPDNYAWFRYREPESVIADTLAVYKVAPMPNATWLAQCRVPAPPLDTTAIQDGFPKPPARRLTFDCTQTWIYPGAEGEVGWYALHAEALQEKNALAQRLNLRQPEPKQTFTARHVEPLAITYRQWDYRETPAFVLYRRPDPTPALPNADVDVFAADATTQPAALTGASRGPVALQGPLTFLGAQVYGDPADESLDVETWWRVEQSGIDRPFSLMAHLLNTSGGNLGVADGLGIAPLAPSSR